MLFTFITYGIKMSCCIIRYQGFIIAIRFITVVIEDLLAMTRKMKNNNISGLCSFDKVIKCFLYPGFCSFLINKRINVLLRKTVLYQCSLHIFDIINRTEVSPTTVFRIFPDGNYQP